LKEKLAEASQYLRTRRRRSLLATDSEEVSCGDSQDCADLNEALLVVDDVTSEIENNIISEDQVTRIQAAEADVESIATDPSKDLLYDLQNDSSGFLESEIEDTNDAAESVKEVLEGDSSNVGAIVGGVIGGLVALGLIVGVVVCVRKKKAKKSDNLI